MSDAGQAQSVVSSEFEPRWRGLILAGGWAALVSAVLMPLAIVAYALWPPPIGKPVVEWFNLFNDNWFVGLLSMDLLLMVIMVAMVPIFFAMAVTMWKRDASIVLPALALTLLAVATFFAANTAFQMLALSKEYATATGEAERAMLIGAGRYALASYQGTAFHFYYIIGAVGGALAGWALLRSPLYSRLTGWLMLAGNVIALGLYVPVVGVYISIFSVLFLEVWDVLIGLRFLALGRRSS